MSPLATHALLRSPSPALTECQLLHLPRGRLDFATALRQHQAYAAALAEAGVAVTTLPAEAHLPDAVFVEDTAVLLDEVAILCRPGTPSRVAEVTLIRPAIAFLRTVDAIQAPGTLEGGDVLRVGRTLFVGRSTRTNPEGIRQLRALVAPHRYEVTEVAVRGALHLKTGITAPAPGLMVANPAWIDLAAFRPFEVVPVPADEPWGANVLPLNDLVLVAAAAPRTAALLRDRGLEVRLVDISELQKAEAGLTCLSLVYRERPFNYS